MKVIKIGAMWCPACIKMGKFWNNVKNNFSSTQFEELDLDMDEDEVKKYNIGDTLPVIIVFDETKEIKRIIGEKKEEELFKELGDVLENDNN